jgi:hypothetical protein
MCSPRFLPGFQFNRQNTSFLDLMDVPLVIFQGHDFLVTSSRVNVTKVTICGKGTYIKVTSFNRACSFSSDLISV